MNIKKSKILISKQLEQMRKAGFGYVTPVIRHALFSLISEKDWESLIPVIEKNNPDIKF